MEEVILVNENDEAIGRCEKIAAHVDGGQLHRAFSVFIFDASDRLLLQRRAKSKYHFGGLWTNSCCGHPRPGEETAAAAVRRVREELGIDVSVEHVFTHMYRATDDDSGLTEHEIDHVWRARFDGAVAPNPSEISKVAWMTVDDVVTQVGIQPDAYTPWFREILERWVVE